MIFDPRINPLALRSPRHWLAFGLGSGLARYAPGTFGTLAAVPLYLLLARLPPVAYALAVAASFLLGVWLCATVSRDLGVHDHGGIVWDEFVGYWIAMFLAPPGWPWVLAGFLLFRLFDVWKPWPIRWFDEHLQGGFGIMFDDVLAGLAACAALQAIRLGTGY